MTGVAAQLCGDRAAVEALGYIVDDAGLIYDPSVNGVDGAEAPTTSPAPSLVVGALAPSSPPSSPRKPFSRLGARKAVLNDLSPAATFIAYNYNTPVDAAAFEAEAKRILREVEAECGWMYETTHTDGRKGRINYTVWSDVFVCPNCSGEIVFTDEALDTETKRVRENFACPNCGVETSKRSLTRMHESVFDTVINVVHERPKRKLVIINYDYQGRTLEKRPDENDLDLLRQITDQTPPQWFPSTRLPYMHMTLTFRQC